MKNVCIFLLFLKSHSLFSSSESLKIVNKYLILNPVPAQYESYKRGESFFAKQVENEKVEVVLRSAQSCIATLTAAIGRPLQIQGDSQLSIVELLRAGKFMAADKDDNKRISSKIDNEIVALHAALTEKSDFFNLKSLGIEREKEEAYKKLLLDFHLIFAGIFELRVARTSWALHISDIIKTLHKIDKENQMLRYKVCKDAMDFSQYKYEMLRIINKLNPQLQPEEEKRSLDQDAKDREKVALRLSVLIEETKLMDTKKLEQFTDKFELLLASFKAEKNK